jgi:hypothetical protein
MQYSSPLLIFRTMSTTIITAVLVNIKSSMVKFLEEWYNDNKVFYLPFLEYQQWLF